MSRVGKSLTVGSLLLVGFLLIGVVGDGCGTSGDRSPQATDGAAILRGHDGDADIDSGGLGPSDTDKDAIPTYGPVAGMANRRAIVSVITRYYEAAAAEDGWKACSLMYVLLVESLLEEHGRGKGKPSVQGNSCGKIASKLFAQRHRELTDDVARLHVTVVQLRRKQAWAVLRFGALDERVVQLQSRGSGWAMDVLLDRGAL